MRKMLLIFGIAFVLITQASAQNENSPERRGQIAGIQLGNYFKETFVYPNILPKSAFRMIKFSSNPNPVLQDDGTYKQYRDFLITDPGDVSTLIYNQYAAGYAYESGLYDFYWNELYTLFTSTQNSDERSYLSNVMLYFNITIQGIEPVNAPPGGPGVMN